LSLNPHPDAVALLKENPEKIVWDFLSTNKNPNAIALLRENPKKINWYWYWFSCVEHNDAITILRENPEKINWWGLSSNSCDAAVSMVFNEIKKNRARPVCWSDLSQNKHPDVIAFLKTNKNIYKLDVICLLENTHPDAIELFEQNMDVWLVFLPEHRHEKFWGRLSSKPWIFEERYVLK